MVIVFQIHFEPTVILAFMVGTVFFYQITMGTQFFVYVSQVGTETQNSFTLFVLWSMVLLMSFTTGMMIETMGIAGTFGTFAFITLMGGVYFILQMRSTFGLSTQKC